MKRVKRCTVETGVTDRGRGVGRRVFGGGV